jgi:CobQ-like glutamine amidotransferase family enzyme
MRQLVIGHLYPKEMNIYGDTGNRLVLERRAAWRGIKVRTVLIGVGDTLPNDLDIIVGGGGQDSGQSIVTEDLLRRANDLQAMSTDGVTMLMICGLYQLFGHYFLTVEGNKLPGIGVFDAVTEAGKGRLIGNITTKTPFGELVGYENHSGLTTLSGETLPLGVCAAGQGNNGTDRTEGARTLNTFGSYLHGPVLVKNPRFADELLRLALDRRYGAGQELSLLDDTLEQAAHLYAAKRSR